MIANSAHTMPQGHLLIESYLYDAIFGTHQQRQLPHLSSLWPDRPADHRAGADRGLQFGARRRRTVPASSWATPRSGPNMRSPRWMRRGAFPTSRWRLSKPCPPENMTGWAAGPATASAMAPIRRALALYSQMVFWLPNGRLLRTRLDLSEGISSRAEVEDVSVYGTGPGFRGHATPGNAFSADASFEYSLTRSWVLALDVLYNHGARDPHARHARAPAPCSGIPAPAMAWVSRRPSNIAGRPIWACCSAPASSPKATIRPRPSRRRWGSTTSFENRGPHKRNRPFPVLPEMGGFIPSGRSGRFRS